jgi:hypothetical protein
MSKTNQEQNVNVNDESFDQISETTTEVENAIQVSDVITNDISNEETTNEVENPIEETTNEVENSIEETTNEVEAELEISANNVEEPIQEVSNDQTNENILIDCIKVDITNLECPMARVSVSQNEIDENRDVFFTNGLHAKSYAQNELSAIKDTILQSEYSEAYWFIETFA